MHIRIVSDHDAKLGMITIIGRGIILKGIEGAMAASAERAPGEITEVDDQVWREPVTFFVYFLRLVHLCADVYTIVVYQRFKLRLELITKSLILVAFDDTPGFAPLDIEEDTGIIATIAPDPGSTPVNLTLVD